MVNIHTLFKPNSAMFSPAQPCGYSSIPNHHVQDWARYQETWGFCKAILIMSPAKTLEMIFMEASGIHPPNFLGKIKSQNSLPESALSMEEGIKAMEWPVVSLIKNTFCMTQRKSEMWFPKLLFMASSLAWNDVLVGEFLNLLSKRGSSCSDEHFYASLYEIHMIFHPE